jgi:hypothetical protein
MAPIWPFKAKQREPRKESWEAAIPTEEHRQLQVIRVDDAHLAQERAAGTQAPMYEIDACAALILDATGYTVRIPRDIPEQRINMVQVLCDGVYALTWIPGVTAYLLALESLTPLKGSAPFGGFKPEAQATIAFGYAWRPKTDPSQLSFCPFWYAMVQVRQGVAD